MPPVSIKYVVSFSSQDERHPVSNIVQSTGYQKWLSHPQERSGQIEAVFQLEQPSRISYIDIGSVWCATLEVKVGRSEWPASREFETLAYTVTLMSPADCLSSRNPNKTQMFSSDLFCPLVAKKEWDRIKVVCRQPYKKMTQYGLSFLRIKSMSSVPKTIMDKKQPSNTTSVKDIRNHFLGRLDNSKDKSSSSLKTKLLKIAASSDIGVTGVEHSDALSRTAKLVLAASGNKSKSYNNGSPVPVSEKNRLYSSRVEQNYGQEFVEDVAGFLKNLVLDAKDLETITLADVRHKLERKKKRKLTKDEKKIFIEEATTYLTSAFRDKKNSTPNRKHVESADKVNQGVVSMKAENFVTNKPASIKENGRKNIMEPDRKQVKRKLENDCAPPPPSKLIKNNKSPMSLIQKMKSVEDHSVTVKHDMIGHLKRVEQNGPIASSVTSPSTPYQYKGLRGREVDNEDSLRITSCAAVADKMKSPLTSGASPRTSGAGPRTPPANITSGMFSDDDESDDDLDVIFPADKTITPNRSTRGKARGRGNGRGRDNGRGRGRGRGRGYGQELNGYQDLSSDLKNCSPQKMDEDIPWLSSKPLVSSKTPSANHNSSMASSANHNSSMASSANHNSSKTPSTNHNRSKTLSANHNGSKTSSANHSSLKTPSANQNNPKTCHNSSSELDSPPWLIAAEVRLQQQKEGGKMTDARSLYSSKKSEQTSMTRSSIPPSVNSSSIASQHSMMEKYELLNNDNVQSQSLLKRNNSSQRKRGKSKGGASNSRRSSGVTQIRFSQFDISDDSDDDAGGGGDVRGDDFRGDDIRGDIRGVVHSSGACGSVASKENNEMMEVMVPCPLCGDSYPQSVIQAHAAFCYL